MKIVVQRVLRSSVSVNDEVIGEIGQGLMILFGAEKGDGDEAVNALADKVLNLRIFADDQGKMNRSLTEVGGDILVVSQFTLAADCRKGNRLGFDKAEERVPAQELYKSFCEHVEKIYKKPQEGQFGSAMKIHAINEGPVTILLDSKSE